MYVKKYGTKFHIYGKYFLIYAAIFRITRRFKGLFDNSIVLIVICFIFRSVIDDIFLTESWGQS